MSDDEPLEVLELFRADKFEDFSLFEWMGETPQRMVADTLFANDKKAADEFLKQVRNAEKDPIRKAPHGDGPRNE